VLEGRCVPSTLTVTTSADETNAKDGVLSLREAIGQAKSGDTIVFDPSLNGQTITLTGSELYIPKSVTIQGNGESLTTISGNDLSRVFDVKNGQTVVLSGMTITGGDGVAAAGTTNKFTDGFGGAILNLGNLTLSDCNVTGNTAVDAGAILNGFHSGVVQSALTVSNCNITDNSATGYAGGIYNVTNATVSNSTISGNSAGLYGGGIYNSAGGAPISINTLTVSGCTVTGNSAGVEGGGIANVNGQLAVDTSFFSANSPDHIFGSFTDGGGNTFV
jgi:hypothetical protein